MPAPLGRASPTKKMPDIQVFGLDNDRGDARAQRFFRERRIVVSFVDLRKRRLAPAELRRFVERLERARCSTSRRERIATAGSATCGWRTTRSSSGCSPGCVPAAAPPRPQRQRCHGGPGGDDVDGLGQGERRRPLTTNTTPIDDGDEAGDGPARVIDHEARSRSSPRPWPIHEPDQDKQRT